MCGLCASWGFVRSGPKGLCRGLCVGCAQTVLGSPPVRTEACRYFSSIFTMTPYYALALSITYLYFYSLLLILLPITTPSYSNLEHAIGLCAQGCAQGCAEGLCAGVVGTGLCAAVLSA